MMKKLLMMMLLILVCFPQYMDAKKKKTTPQAPAKKEEPRAPIKEGLFNIQHQKDDWVFQVHDSLLNRPFLAVTRFIATPVDAQVYGGEMTNSQVLYFQKSGNNLLLRSWVLDAQAKPDEAIYKAVQASASDPIIASLKIDSVGKKDKKLYSVTLTKLLKSDNGVLGLSSSSKRRFNLTGFQADRSFIETVNTYPINTEIKTVATYGTNDKSRLPSAMQTGAATFHLNISLVMLPKEPMRPRLLDPRVGYFADGYNEYSDDQQQVKSKRFAVRWRLEPKNAEDAAKQRNGQLIEPKKQIVYYVDPATPKQWVKYLIMGVNDWNAAFEEAGWKNAIVGKEWPNDSTMSLEDARFSVIRYLASPIANAYGPQVHDPRSGEILESHIGWYHNVMQLVHDWYMVQAGCVDARARKMKFDDELMGQLIRFVSSHEVGHTLGLRHNKGASSATPVEKLRDKAWVEKNGHTSSIMDYARFNYVAQPEDNISESGIFPRINDYDKWAIKWGYMIVPNVQNEEQERLALNKMTVKTLENNPRLWFGGEGYDNDPRAQSEDLSDDAVKASDYGILNLQRMIKVLPEWTFEEGNMGENLSQVYASLRDQYRRYMGHVASNIGGIYHQYKSVEEAGSFYEPVERARQKKALDFLNKRVFTEPKWLIAEDYVTRITRSPESLLYPIVDGTVNTLVSDAMMSNLSKYAYGKDPYQPNEYVKDLVGMVFSEASTGAKVSSYRRYLQKKFVTRLTSEWLKDTSSQGHTYLLSMLNAVQNKVKNARTADEISRAHYTDLTQLITEAFEHPVHPAKPQGGLPF